MPERGRTTERDERIFGPGWAYYLLPLLCLTAAGLCFHGYGSTTSAEAAGLLLALAAVLVVVAVVFLLVQWVVFRLDRHGIERRALDSLRHWPWERIGGVVGRELQTPRAAETTWSAWGFIGRGSSPLVRRVVVDVEGRPLFRISPWTRRPRDLAAEIRHHVQRERD